MILKGGQKKENHPGTSRLKEQHDGEFPGFPFCLIEFNQKEFNTPRIRKIPN